MQFITNLNTINQSIINQVPNGMAVIAVVWLAHILNWISGYRLLVLGIFPRRIHGLIGIVFAPFLHANYDHIFFNSVPLFILSTFLMTSELQRAVYVTMGIMLIGGILTWLFARRAIHVGASGLIMGYMGFLLTEFYYDRSPAAWIIGIVTLYYLGSLLLSLVPGDDSVSFEGHIFGFIAGIIMSYFPIPLLYTLATDITPDVHYVLQTVRSFF